MAARVELIHELVANSARLAPQRPALISPTGLTWSFAEFDRRIAATADWVAARSNPGDRIAVIADNSLDYARLYYGVPRSGRLLTLVNQRLSAAEQSAQLATVTPALLIGDERYLSAVAADVPTVTFDDPGWRAAEPGDDTPAVTDPDTPAWLLFTSGSTGVPKGVVHTHRSITTAVRGSVAGRAVRPGGVYLLPFPMCHIAGYNMLVQHSAQSTVLPVATYRPDTFARTVDEYAVTSCSLAPTMLHSLLAYLDETGMNLPSLREIAYGSAAIPADLLRRAIERLDVDFHQGYGMTETGGNITFLGPAAHRAGAAGDEAVLATAGRPHDDVEIRIASGADGAGEIMVRGEQVAQSYWPDRPATVDGWLPTGDVGRFDADGNLVVVDRMKDVIITGGENVASREVEDVLSQHPDIAAVAVVGVPDEYWGEAVCAVVVAGARTPTAEEVIATARARLAGFKRPRHVLFVDELPLTSNGKVAKVVVRQLARRQLMTTSTVNGEAR
ncbi:MAG: AMP-binding protein [Mycobacterium sp.]|nr:AMP-binding protein [Mycobacterium sp.]